MIACPFKNSKTYLIESENTALALLNVDQKINLLNYISKHNIKLDKTFGFNPDTTFGIEIEFDSANYYKYDGITYLDWFEQEFGCDSFQNNEEYNNFDWGFGHENDTTDEFKSPIFKDNIKSLESIRKVYNILNKYELGTNEGSSLQISVGGQIFDKDIDKLINFLKVYTVFEKELFAFSKHESEFIRDESAGFSVPIAEIMLSAIEIVDTYRNNFEDYLVSLGYNPTLINGFDETKKKELLFSIIKNVGTHVNNNKDKISALKLEDLKLFDNFEDKNRIEFRFPNATTHGEYAMNTISTLVKLVENTIDGNPLINYYFNIYKDNKSDYSSSYSPYDYSECELDKALQLCDVIFNNNLDKFNFLKHLYNKDYELECEQQKMKK